jgi:DivIVA domain-containing protein
MARPGRLCATLTGVRDSTWPLVVLLLLALAAVTVAVLRRRDGDASPASGPFAPGGTVGGAAGGASAGTGSPTVDAAQRTERFRRGGRLGGGYRRDEVDAFFARIDAGRVSHQEIEDVRFGSASGRGSYDEREVDEALDRVATRLRGPV